MFLKPSYRFHTRSILFHRQSILVVPRVSLFTLEEDCILEGGILEGQSHAGHHTRKPLWLVSVFLTSLLVWKGHCYVNHLGTQILYILFCLSCGPQRPLFI